ncbi:outer membrane beta-barrel domain protein [Lysobacter capsici]|uniref:OmpA family protein n=1 Tax=Lysobacter capsici TaxID=435897 RepID=UPI0007166469|nr:OmpA family protein [Lysobacter capsici]ALN87124.1 outer membrane beta-barrel domain protein [Lysobacter capsici]WND79123.1 OmpA family protein [Lysobacter capsici]WND84318.1 OmpA family protein [Lysobacter capsici]
MNKKLLCAALLGGLSLAQVASAQDFDDRWYLTGSAGMNIQDNDRGTRNAPFGAIGLGKFLNKNWSLDGELNYQNPKFDANQDANWSQYGISLDLRRHFVTEGRNWNPYLLMGLGYQRSEEEYFIPSPLSPANRKDGNFAAKVGLGVQGDLGRVGIRTELAYRADFDDQSVNAREEDWFGDVLASVGIIVPLGPEPVAAVAPAPEVQPGCADKDDDGDGVNNCDDKCPGSQAGQTIGPDGCPVPVTIDLKGVNFDFDKATLRPDAVAILSEASEILKRYPDLKVEVAGHTDLCGKDDYNQKLSERRAKAAYDYLTSNGVDAGRLIGPVGYGESRPLEPTAQTMPACKSEKNRRTELNVQN